MGLASETVGVWLVDYIYIPHRAVADGYMINYYRLVVDHETDVISYSDPKTTSASAGGGNALWECWGYDWQNKGNSYCHYFKGDLGINAQMMVQPSHVTGISTTAATLHALIGDVASNASERGFEWDSSPTVANPPTYDNDWTEEGDFGIGAFSHEISSLTAGTIYHFRPKALVGETWYYGSDMTFVTVGCLSKENGIVMRPVNHLKALYGRKANGTEITMARYNPSTFKANGVPYAQGWLTDGF